MKLLKTGGSVSDIGVCLLRKARRTAFRLRLVRSGSRGFESPVRQERKLLPTLTSFKCVVVVGGRGGCSIRSLPVPTLKCRFPLFPPLTVLGRSSSPQPPPSPAPVVKDGRETA